MLREYDRGKRLRTDNLTGLGTLQRRPLADEAVL
jgi:hypothetical protein